MKYTFDKGELNLKDVLRE